MHRDGLAFGPLNSEPNHDAPQASHGAKLVRKNSLLSLLLCVNVGLLVALALATTSPKLALAQASGLSGHYLAVSAEVRDQFDALYLLDTRSRLLHGFYYDLGARRLQYLGSRDLERDFRNN